MKPSTHSCILGLVFACSAFACGDSASSDASGPEDGEEGELGTQSSLVPEAVAVIVEIVPYSDRFPALKTTVGASAKVQKIFKGLKKRRDDQSSPRCMPNYQTKLQFLDKHGFEIASTALTCGDGKLNTANGPPVLVRASAEPEILEIAKMPLVPADALFGIVEVDVRDLRNQVDQRVADEAGVKELLKAIDLDQKIDTEYAFNRCMPTHMISFKRSCAPNEDCTTRDVAGASFICGSDPQQSSITGSFSIVNPANPDAQLIYGAIKLDPRPYVRVTLPPPPINF